MWKFSFPSRRKIPLVFVFSIPARVPWRSKDKFSVVTTSTRKARPLRSRAEECLLFLPRNQLSCSPLKAACFCLLAVGCSPACLLLVSGSQLPFRTGKGKLRPTTCLLLFCKFCFGFKHSHTHLFSMVAGCFWVLQWSTTVVTKRWYGLQSQNIWYWQTRNKFAGLCFRGWKLPWRNLTFSLLIPCLGWVCLHRRGKSRSGVTVEDRG